MISLPCWQGSAWRASLSPYSLSSHNNPSTLTGSNERRPACPRWRWSPWGLAPTNTWSLIEAVFRRQHIFVRTPKFNVQANPGGRGRQERIHPLFPVHFDPLTLAELGLALYALLGAAVAVMTTSYGSLPFLLMSAAGLGYTAVVSLQEISA